MCDARVAQVRRLAFKTRKHDALDEMSLGHEKDKDGRDHHYERSRHEQIPAHRHATFLRGSEGC